MLKKNRERESEKKKEFIFIKLRSTLPASAELFQLMPVNSSCFLAYIQFGPFTIALIHTSKNCFNFFFS